MERLLETAEVMAELNKIYEEHVERCGVPVDICLLKTPDGEEIENAIFVPVRVMKKINKLMSEAS